MHLRCAKLSPCRGFDVAGSRVRVALAATVCASLAAAALSVSAPADAATGPCPNVYLIGAPGSGELTGLGAPVTAFNNALLTALASRVTERHQAVAYTTDKASADLVPTVSQAAGYLLDVGSFYDNYKRDHVDRYVASVADGVAGVEAALSTINARCGTKTKFVLSGYSQGAMAVHEALEDIAGQATAPAYAGQIAATVLIADPDEVQNGSGADLGTAPSDHTGLTHNTTNIPPRFAGATWSICASNDIVCDFRPADYLSWATAGMVVKRIKAAVKVHQTDYTATNPALPSAASAVADALTGTTLGPIEVINSDHVLVGSNITITTTRPCPVGSDAAYPYVSVDGAPALQAAPGAHVGMGLPYTWTSIFNTAEDTTNALGGTADVTVYCRDISLNDTGVYETLHLILGAGATATVTYQATGPQSGNVTVMSSEPCPYPQPAKVNFAFLVYDSTRMTVLTGPTTEVDSDATGHWAPYTKALQFPFVPKYVTAFVYCEDPNFPGVYAGTTYEYVMLQPAPLP
ncbi:MAG: cutinase family protein [Actinomycetales bacterium]